MRTSRLKALLLSSLVVLAAGALATSTSVQAQTWVHPGVLVSQAQLDATKAAYEAGNPVIVSQVAKAQASDYGSLTYTPKGPWPGGVEQCGSDSNPDDGCSDSDSDSDAAYVQAILWVITGNQTYANNSIKIMNAYSANFKGFAGYTTGLSCPSGTGCSNGPLQAAWDSEKWPRAAEIIRYANGGSAGWSSSSITAFTNMLNNIYLPIIQNGSGVNGNWDMSMIEGIMGIAVFTQNSSLLSTARTFWLGRVPDLFYYFPQDGDAHAASPRGNPTWWGQSIFNSTTSGVSQETCRDLRHAEDSLAGAINTAETDYIQGGTLYTNASVDAEARIVLAMNQLAGLESKANHSTTNPPLIAAPTDFCTSSGGAGIGEISPGVGMTYSIGYNEYHNRLNNPNMANGSGTTGLNGTANTFNWIQNGVLTADWPIDEGNHMTLYEALTHTVISGETVPPPACETASTTWSNTPFTAQTGSFIATFTAVPSAADINTVIGLSEGAQTAYTGLTALARFNPSGDIDAYNGTAYAAASTIPYTAGTTYGFEFDVNIVNKTYTVYVTPPGGAKTLVGQNYAFRAAATTLNNLSLYAAAGSDDVCSFVP